MRRKSLFETISTLSRSEHPIAWCRRLIRDDNLQLERFHLLCCPLRRLYPVPFCLSNEGEERGKGEEVTSTDFRLTVDLSENRPKAGIIYYLRD